MNANHLIIIGAAIFFFLHLVCENTSSFAKYNFASIGKHMQGVSLANIFAVFSRGFVALYGLSIAYVIEKQNINIEIYSFYLSAALLGGACFSFFLSKISLNKLNSSIKSNARNFILYNKVFDENLYKNIKINGLLRFFIGVQFIAIVIAYGICFKFPNNRLFIISLVPVISMLGTIVTVMLVEPRLARFIDSSSDYGCMVSREFMRARALSFLSSFFIIIILNASLRGL